MRNRDSLFAGLLICCTLLFGGCSNEVWTDPDTGLTWQTQSRDAENPEFLGIIPIEAYEYCQDLESGGFDDWRLPSFAELQTIVAGNPNVEPGGLCQVGAPGAGTAQGKTAVCAGTGAGGDYGGPGLGGCYWKEGLAGSCEHIDPFGTHPYETWAVDVANDKPYDWVSYITFATGAGGYNHACSLAEVRCVRSDEPAPECMVDGLPCHSYYRSKADCEQDFTDQADILRVTVTLPEDPKVDPPYQLMGFMYRADPTWFPPLGPPDGGTDYNQIFLSEPGAPVINATTSYTMDIPGTTYYREALLYGDFQLFFELQLNNAFPPIPSAGDFVYGENELAISFPFNGVEHTGQILEIDVELTLVGCPDATPVSCWDASCAVNEASCPAVLVCPEDSSCYPNCPSDDDIYTCLYENLFTGGAIAMVDYPFDEGWTESAAISDCAAILGASNPQIVQGRGQSALVQIGGNSAGRCVFTAIDGKRSYAQDLGEAICGLGSGIWVPSGPYCETY